MVLDKKANKKGENLRVTATLSSNKFLLYSCPEDEEGSQPVYKGNGKPQ